MITLKKIENDYKAGLFKVNLQSDDTASKISQWVSSHTNGKLGTEPSEFKITDPGEVMEIFNAIYFKDEWVNQFYKDQTVACDIYSGNGYKTSSLNFANGNKMMFILPDEGKSPYDILENGDTLQEAVNSLSDEKGVYSEVSFSVPKFDYKTTIDLNKCAKDLGIENIYNSDADFTKFSKNGNLHVSKIKQNTCMTVNENGAEASAYTQIEFKCTSALMVNHDEMNLNRPFLFAITDNNNTPLFIGVVNNPTVDSVN